MTSTCPDENALAMLAEGGVDAAVRAGIEAHLDACASCSEVVAELAGLSAPALPPRYRAVRRLGAGAMGEVWECEDVELSRRVAVKRVAEAAGEQARARLVREAKALAQLRHGNVVGVYDIAVAAGEVFVAMELVEGTTARAWAASGRSPGEVLAVWRQAAAGLAAVHRAGMVHRDVKPDNVFVARDGRVVLGDFGLATSDAVGPVATTLTETGAVVGTPVYMAPEQLAGEAATAASDQFALAASIWEALAGARPFDAKTAAGLALAMTKPPVPPPGSDARGFAALVRALSFEPSARFADVEAFAQALTSPSPSPSGRAGILVAVAAAVCVAGIAIGVSIARAGESETAPAPIEAPDIEARRLDEAATVASRSASHDDPPPAPGSAERWSQPERRSGAGSGSGTRTDTDDAPPRAKVSAWVDAEVAVTTAINARDAKACLAQLDHLPAMPADKVEEFVDYRVMCTMLVDCAAGHALYAKKAQRSAAFEDTMDATYCPLDAAPESRWAARTSYQFQYAIGTKHGCERVGAFADAHHLLVGKDANEDAVLRIACDVQRHDCASARERWKNAHFYDGGFDSAFKDCK